MKHYIGLIEFNLRQKNEERPAVYEPERLINAHMLLCGMSGTGKSFQSMRFLDSAARDGVEIDVFDVHEELDGLTNAVACRYSQSTGYGYNPLELDDDPHTGGVDRQIAYIVNLVRDATPQFGAKQEAALRYILMDTYAASGIYQSNPSAWTRKKIDEATRQDLIEGRKWSELRAYYPTMEDLRSYARRKIMALTLGGDNKSISALDAVMKSVSRMNAAQKRYNKASSDEDREKAEKALSDLKAKAHDAYGDFLENVETGREFDDIIKYDSTDVLTNVIQRMDVLNGAGIFRANEPPFGNARVRVHQIKALSNDQQVLFVKLRLRSIFERHKREGATKSGNEVRHIIFLDEAHKYFSDEPDDIINVIAKEGRKFGIGLWCASQQPTEFPESFLTNVGATVLLGIHASYWKRSASLLRISEDTLKWIKPKEVMSIKLQRDGVADPSFQNIVVPNPNNEFGRRAMGK